MSSTPGASRTLQHAIAWPGVIRRPMIAWAAVPVQASRVTTFGEPVVTAGIRTPLVRRLPASRIVERVAYDQAFGSGHRKDAGCARSHAGRCVIGADDAHIDDDAGGLSQRERLIELADIGGDLVRSD